MKKFSFKTVQSVVQTVLLGGLLTALSIGCWTHTAAEYSTAERRPLKQYPEMSSEMFLSGKFMTEFEEYATDQFPMRDSFRALKAFVTSKVFLQLDNNKVYESSGHISKLEYPFSEEAFSHAKRVFDRINKDFLNESNNVYFSVIPDKNAFLAPQTGRLSLDYDAFYKLWSDYCAEKGNIQFIDIASKLELSDYYTTDTHWKQECLTDVAQTLAQAMAVSIPSQYTENALDTPFYGVYNGQYALPTDPDQIRYLTNDVIDNFFILDYSDNPTKPKEIPLYDFEKATDKDPYDFYLTGERSLITIENPNASSDKELIVFRDSFGRSLIPLLAQGYKKVTIVDIRYLDSHYLGRFIDFSGKDVLFLYSSLVLNTADDTLK